MDAVENGQAFTVTRDGHQIGGQNMLRGDFSEVPAIKDLIRARAERMHKGQRPR